MGRRQLAETAGVGVVFFLAALLGLRVGLSGTAVSPVWIASGVALAGALLFGRHVLVGVFVGAVLAEWTLNPLSLSLALGLANVAEPLIAATALQYFAGGRCDLLRTRDTAVLLLFGAGVGPRSAPRSAWGRSASRWGSTPRLSPSTGSRGGSAMSAVSFS